jgi:hypothetical protein
LHCAAAPHEVLAGAATFADIPVSNGQDRAMSSVAVASPLDLSSHRPRFAGLGEFCAVGGLTPVFFALSWLLRRAYPLDPLDYGFGFTTFYAANLINNPHFAVTYLLFYRDVRARAFGGVFVPAQRARYLLAGFAVPLVLGAWAVAALSMKSAPMLGLLIQLMFLLVGWHYVKQGFGVMTVLAARRGVSFLPRERLAILAHCYAGWAYAWASPYDPGRELEEKGVVYRSIAHPRGLEGLTLIVLLATIPPLVWVLAQKWRRERRFPLLTPLLALLCSVWAWSIYASIDPLVKYVVPALHSLQYLYFVRLMKRNEAREREGPPWFETSARVRLAILALSAVGLGWLFFHGAPVALDDALLSRRHRFDDLGETPCFAALYAFVNIHHYFMDFVLWRRENPETRFLRG